MKPIILNRIAGAAVVLALPAVLMAQDLTPDPSGQSSGSMPPAPGIESSTPSSALPGQQQQQGEVSSGIIVEDGSAYVIHKLQNEMALPDGSKVSPDGTVTKSDGSVQHVEKGKILSLDGRIVDAPFMDEQKQPAQPQATPEKPRMPSTSPETPSQSIPEAPQSGVGVPETGSPFSSPSAPDQPDPSVSPDPSDSSLDTPQTPPDASSEQLTPEYTD